MEENPLSDQLFKKLSDLMFEKTGITLKEHKKYLVMHRLAKFVGQGKNFKNFQDYYKELKENPDSPHVREFINRLTTNYSYFFRDPVHFDFLEKYLKENIDNQSYIRLWSAACSTGEETYSMAIASQQALPDIDMKIDYKILGLYKAHAGVYEAGKINGHVPEKEQKKFFDYLPDQNAYRVKERIKKMIAFRNLNLMGNYPFNKLFDVVFLRNVLIYFDEKEKELAVNKIYDHVKEGGYLITGLSESLVGIKHKFRSVKYSIYQKS
jgi:chemotaxis protein methyltransferase CheR